MDGDGDGDDDDDDPDEVKLDDGDDGDVFLPPGRNFPADFSLPESFSLSVVYRLVAAAEYLLDRCSSLRVSGG